MYICACKGLTEDHLREIIAERGCSIKEAIILSSGGECCGGCLKKLRLGELKLSLEASKSNETDRVA